MDYNPEISSADKLLTTWKKGLKQLSSFWKNMKRRLLAKIEGTPTDKTETTKSAVAFSANIGDVVLVKDELPRASWKRMGAHQKQGWALSIS